MKELSEIIGMENLQKLSDYFGGEYIYIPTREHLDMKKRNEKINETFTTYLQQGSTCMNAYQSIANEINLSTRRVRQIIASC